MGDLTLQDIDDAESAVKRVRVILQGIGRELYRMREGVELGPEYGFERYQRFNFAGSHYADQEGPDWSVGTPIFSLQYYWSRGENVVNVTFPLGWLEQDWRALERARLDEDQREQDKARRAAEEEAAVAREEADRRTFERLKAKFEPSRSLPTPDEQRASMEEGS